MVPRVRWGLLGWCCLPESDLLPAEVHLAGRGKCRRSAFPLVVSVVDGCCSCILMGVVRLIGLVPSGLVLSGS